MLGYGQLNKLLDMQTDFATQQQPSINEEMANPRQDISQAFGAWAGDSYITRLLDNPWFKILSRVQNAVYKISNEWLNAKDLGCLNYPVDTHIVSCPSAPGSDSSAVQIRLRGQETFLTDSNQFFLELGCRMFRNGSYSILPCFRGDSPDESHLSQFYQAEVELPVAMQEAMEFAEIYLRELSVGVLRLCADQIEECGISLAHVRRFAFSDKSLPTISFNEACRQLPPRCIERHEKLRFRRINREGERILMQLYGGAVWLTHMDYMAVPFYQAPSDREWRSAKTADLLMGIGEVIGLGERHSSPNDLKKAMELHGIHPDDYRWYMQLRESAPIRTSGFGIGLERFYCWLLGHSDVRDCQIFPRLDGRRSPL